MLRASALLLTALTLSIGLLAPATSQAAEHGVITIYHHVDSSTPPSTSLSPEQFREHMSYLRDNGFNVMPLDALITSLQSKNPVPDRSVAITFDDGYISIYTEAFPLLQQLGFPFAVFVNTQPINDQLDGYMSWEQIREMADAGVLIANHMVEHPHMVDNRDGEDDTARVERLRQELRTAQQQIEQRTGQSHRLMAYPYGEYDALIKQMVAEEGFIGIAQHSGAAGFHSDFRALPRFPLAGIFAAMDNIPTKLSSMAFHVLSVDPPGPITDSRTPELTLQLQNNGFRADALACYAGEQRLEIKWVDREQLIFSVQAEQDMNSRRFNYNCTAPAVGERDRYFWYSKLWIRSTLENQD